MSHDIFISHSSEDKIIADSVTAALEQANIRCWIAPRDIRPGDSWGGAIVEAIESSRVMVVIFSANSNDSKQVMREVERAVQHDAVVVPFRIEDVQPTKDMEYFLSSTHWLDAMTPEMGEHLQKLSKTVSHILEKPLDDKTAASAGKKAAKALSKETMSKSASAKPAKSRLNLAFTGLAGLVFLAVAGYFFFSGDDSSTPQKNDSSASELTKAQDLEPRDNGDVKLILADKARAGAELEVKWRGNTADNDYIAIVPADSAENFTSGSKPLKGKDSLLFDLTDKPGDYQVRFVDAATRRVITRESLTIGLPGVTLDAPEKGLAGTMLSIAWSGPNDRYDHLAIAKPNAAGREYETYSYISKGSPTEVRLPDAEGEYRLRYVSGGGKEVWKEQQIEVAKPDVEIKVASTQGAGAEIDVDWSGPANKGDFITVASPQMDGKDYLSYSYARAGRATKLRMPAEAGNYEIRYISGQSKEKWAVVPVSITMPEVSIQAPTESRTGDLLKLDWQGPANKGDYVSFAERGSEGKSYLVYKYLKPGRTARAR